MKRTISILFGFFTMLMLVTGCRKEDDAKIPDLIRIPTPLVTIDAGSDQVISPVDPASFNGKFTVDLFFKNDIAPQKMDVVIRKNNGAVKTFETVTTFPTTLEVTGQELITLFGEPISGGDQFDIGVDITTREGQTYLAFPTTGAPYGSTIFNQPGANTSVSFLAPCAFDASQYAGDFEVLQDEWDDYGVGDVVTVKVINATQLSFEYNVNAGTAKPIILTIDPATNAITVTKQSYGKYTFPPPTEFFVESVAGPASAVNPCDLSLSVRLSHSDETGADYGNYTIRLRKKS
jgi:hypothetical protein